MWRTACQRLSARTCVFEASSTTRPVGRWTQPELSIALCRQNNNLVYKMPSGRSRGPLDACRHRRKCFAFNRLAGRPSKYCADDQKACSAIGRRLLRAEKGDRYLGVLLRFRQPEHIDRVTGYRAMHFGQKRTWLQLWAAPTECGRHRDILFALHRERNWKALNGRAQSRFP
jgi:hypothetical protein